jgi:hypothetical protein
MKIPAPGLRLTLTTNSALFDDNYPTDPEQGAPVLWSNPAVPDLPEDDFIQYDPVDIL